MFRLKVLLRNLTKCSKCQFKKLLVRNFNNALLCHLDSTKIPWWRTEINGFQEFYLLQQSVLDDGTSKKFFSNISDERCWNCKKNLEWKKFTCASCGVLQYPKKHVNYFELFGISQTFDIDLEDLSTKFKNLQKAFHPDKFVNKSEIELEISEMYSRLVNKAYTTLKDPLARGFYLLELQKVPVDNNFPVGQEFLLTVMEKNEELETINSTNILESFSKVNSEEVDKQIAMISRAFQNSKWNDARQNLMKLNYFVNLDSKIKKKHDDIISSKNT